MLKSYFIYFSLGIALSDNEEFLNFLVSGKDELAFKLISFRFASDFRAQF